MNDYLKIFKQYRAHSLKRRPVCTQRAQRAFWLESASPGACLVETKKRGEEQNKRQKAACLSIIATRVLELWLRRPIDMMLSNACYLCSSLLVCLDMMGPEAPI